MVLTKHEMANIGSPDVYGMGPIAQYRISGLPAGENALIAEFTGHGWRILRWNTEWHGNWSGSYASVDHAIDKLREELSAFA